MLLLFGKEAALTDQKLLANKQSICIQTDRTIQRGELEH